MSTLLNINSFEELKIHPLYNKLADDYPIIYKYSKNLNNNVNIKLNYYNESISNTLSKDNLIGLIKFLVDLIHKLDRSDKIIISLLIYEIILNHENFLIDNKKFLSVCLDKVTEFKNLYYDDFEHFKLYNDNINPIDTIFEKFNKLNNTLLPCKVEDIKISKEIPSEILSKYTIPSAEINDKIVKQKLKLNNHGNFNFKTNSICNEEDFNISFGIYLNILSSSKTTHHIVIIYTQIFELFINNIDFIKKNELLKSFLINKNKELIKSNFSDFEKLKIYNYNKNPLETVVNLIKFYC